jgi:uncharacterized membrane protein
MTGADWALSFGVPGGASTAAVIAVVALALLAWSIYEARGASRPGWLLAVRAVSVLGGAILAAQPVWLAPRVETTPGRLAILFDTSRSMGIGATDHTRAAEAEDLARRWAGEAESAQASSFVFDDHVSPAELAALGASYPAEGERTALLDAVRELAEGDGAEDLGAIVVVSDGAETADVDAAALGGLGVRVHTVLAAGPAIERDDAVLSVGADSVVFLRQPFEIEANVRCIGCDAERLSVTLWRGDQVQAQTEVALDDDGLGTARFSVTETRLGRRVFRVTVPRAAADQVPENNTRPVLVRVVRDRLRVLLVAGRPSWDVRFLRAFLKRDPSIDLVSFFILRTNSDLTMADASQMALIPFPTDELFREHLGSFDLVIFQNFNYGPYRMAPYLGRVRDYVRRGGAFAMIGGDVSFAAGGYAGTPVAEILPVSLRPVSSGGSDVTTEPFGPVIDPEHRGHPLLAFSPDAQSNAELWSNLAPLVGMNMVAGLREGARPLLNHPSRKLASGEPMPVLVVGEAGDGRVLALMSDTAWRWGIATAGRTGDASTYARFWDRTLRWLARDPALEPSRVTTDRERYGPGAVVRVNARLRTERYAPRSGLAVRVQILDEADEVVSEVLARTDRDGRLEASLEGASSPGAFRAVVREAAAPPILGEEPFLVEAAGDELTDPRPRPELLARLSASTGGKTYTVASAPDLDAIDTRREHSLGYATVAPFERPLFVVPVMLVWALEWFLRRRRGLL